MVCRTMLVMDACHSRSNVVGDLCRALLGSSFEEYVSVEVNTHKYGDRWVFISGGFNSLT